MTLNTFLKLSFGVTVLTGYVAGCANSADQCEQTATCKPVSSAGSSSETGGTSGKSSTGGASGTQKGGTGGIASASSGGKGGASTTAPCNGACKGSTPICDTDKNECVECTTSDDCKADATKSVCNTTAGKCVACNENTDCKDATASRCDTATNTCAACSIDDDCKQISGKGICLTGDATLPNQCVQCTGKRYSACGQLEGADLVCDSLARTCTTDKKVKSSAECKPCVSDAQCIAGQLCAKQMFGGKLVGHFCFWKQGDTANGAPTDCTLPANRPYVNVQADVLSIDNDSGTLCMLRAVTSCPALNDYSAKSCVNNNKPEEQLCGFAPGEDSKCIAFGSSQYLCTNTCGSDLDCKQGFTCNVATNPDTCTLQ
jgi:hypothetical protein